MRRREFVTAIAAGLGVGMAPGLLHAGIEPAKRPLKLLVLGGTGFLGPHTVEYALGRGHEITLFNRGKTNLGLFPDLETIIGDRDPDVDAGLSGLAGRRWDAVIDNSGYVPRMVGASAERLSGNADQYVFVSTICQYENWAEGGAGGTEERPRATIDDPQSEDVSAHYCQLKGYCERSLEASFDGRITHVRPGLIVGPLDRSDRYTYWPVRMAGGGEVLAPGKPEDPTQFIDVRDLAAFLVRCVESRAEGAFNAVSMPMAWGDFLTATRDAVNPDAKLTWVPADFLAEQDVQPWRDLHMWADGDSPLAGSLTWSSEKAIAAGLTFRPVAETARDTLAWWSTLPGERRENLRAGMSVDREREVLAAWHARK